VGELSSPDVPGGGNPQPRYPLAAALGDEVGVEGVTPTRRGVAQDPSIGNPALSRAGWGSCFVVLAADTFYT